MATAALGRSGVGKFVSRLLKTHQNNKRGATGCMNNRRSPQRVVGYISTEPVFQQPAKG